MILATMDQIVSWAVVLMCWWIVHQTANANFSLANLLMRVGVGGFGLCLACLTLLRLGELEAHWSAIVLKSLLVVMFSGVILFHFKRFSKL